MTNWRSVMPRAVATTRAARWSSAGMRYCIHTESAFPIAAHGTMRAMSDIGTAAVTAANGDLPDVSELPPENVAEVVRRSCRLLWEGNDVGVGIKERFSDHPDQYAPEDVYQAGVDAAITVWHRLIPGPSPTDGVHHDIVQLWTHQRFLLGHAINNTETLTALKEFIEEKFAAYEHLLPKPGSLAARAGAWGARNGRA